MSAEITASIPLPFNALTATTSKLLSAFLPITALFSSKTQHFAASIAALSSFPLFFSCASAESKISSILFKANTTGVCFFANSRLHSASSLKAFLNGIPAFFAAMTSAISSTTTAISVFSAARWVFSTRLSPSSLSSSKPAVSIITHGPSGCISIGLYTGSVVVPATSATMETSCFVTAFIRDDLPLFVFPYIPI